jgi:hypothetical protein
MPQEPQPFKLNVGWAVDLMSTMHFTPDEMKRVTFLSPFEDRAHRAMRGGIIYNTDTGQAYEYKFLVGIHELMESSIDILAWYYEQSLCRLEKDLRKIRQVETATKRLMGEAKRPEP